MFPQPRQFLDFPTNEFGLLIFVKGGNDELVHERDNLLKGRGNGTRKEGEQRCFEV